MLHQFTRFPTLLARRSVFAAPSSARLFSDGPSSHAPSDEWPTIGEAVPITLNDGDPTPTIQPYSEYPDWLTKLAGTPETMAKLAKDYKKHRSAQESENPDEKLVMEYDRIMRLKKLQNRDKIKSQNETSNDF
jgi:hypothetical protein